MTSNDLKTIKVTKVLSISIDGKLY